MRTGIAAAVLALAACSSPSGPTVSITATTPAGWSGTTEALIHDATGAFVRRTPFVGHADVAFEAGQIVTVVAQDVRESLATYYGLEAGDSVAVAIGTPGDVTRHAVDVHLPSGPASSMVLLAVGGFTSMQAAAGAVVPYQLPVDRATLPMLASVKDATHVVGFYGGSAIDASGASVTLDQALGMHSVAIAVDPVPTGAAVSRSGFVWAGDDSLVVPAPFAATADTVALPDGIGDHEEVVANLYTTDWRIFLAANFDGAAPAQVDLGHGPIAPPTVTAAHFDGAQTSWVATGGVGTAIVQFSVSAAPPGAQYTTEWQLSAPPDATSEPLPTLPTDLVPAAAWQSEGLSIFAGDGADYRAWVADPRWMFGAGAHRWGGYFVTMTP